MCVCKCMSLCFKNASLINRNKRKRTYLNSKPIPIKSKHKIIIIINNVIINFYFHKTTLLQINSGDAQAIIVQLNFLACFFTEKKSVEEMQIYLRNK